MLYVILLEIYHLKYIPISCLYAKLCVFIFYAHFISFLTIWGTVYLGYEVYIMQTLFYVYKIL